MGTGLNAAYTGRYAAYRGEHDALFVPACRSGQAERVIELGEGLAVRSRHYEGRIICAVHASENELMDGAGRVLYQWRNLNDDGEFVSLVRHGNGRRYLIFRRELYGYSVLEIDTGRDFHFVPEESFPERRENFRETFIWTGASYDPVSSLLAASGCFWACPNDTLVLDFSRPLGECPTVDLHEVLDPDYEKYDGIDLDRWDGQGGMVLRVSSAEDGRYSTLCVRREELLDELGIRS